MFRKKYKADPVGSERKKRENIFCVGKDKSEKIYIRGKLCM